MLSSTENSILEGDFKRVTLHFQKQIDQDPNNRNYTGGYFAVKFWSNRQDLIFLESEGKHRAAFLLQEWEQFDKEVQRRALGDLAIIRVIMRYIFALAAQNLRLVFIQEGARSVNVDLLYKMGECLILCQDYQNAWEVLDYTKSQHGESARLFLHLAEAAWHLEKEELALSYFREALFLSHNDIRLDLIQAGPLLDLKKYVILELKKEDQVADWMFIYGVALGTLNQARLLKNDQLGTLLSELEFIENEFSKKSGDVRKKLRIYLTKQYLYFMDYYVLAQKDSNSHSDFADRLRQLDESIYKLYRESRQSSGYF